MLVEEVAIPVTRWKRGAKGIKPVVAPMMRPISSARKPDNSRIGRKTPCFRSEQKPMPKGTVSGNVQEWLNHIQNSIKTNSGIVPVQVIKTYVPRGTF
jgi:hypothetical protein